MPRERLRKQADRLLEEFLKEVSPLKPRCVILYGSYARETFTESSDIDVCVIAENLPKDEMVRRSLFGLYSTPKIRAIGFHPDEFLDYLKGLRFLAYEIVHDGSPLLDDGFLKEAREVCESCMRKYKVIKQPKGWRWGRL